MEREDTVLTIWVLFRFFVAWVLRVHDFCSVLIDIQIFAHLFAYSFSHCQSLCTDCSLLLSVSTAPSVHSDRLSCVSICVCFK